MKSRFGRIRVLHLIDSLELGGAQTVLLAWFQYYDRTKFEVHLASIHGTPKSLFYTRAEDLGIPVILLSPRRWLPSYVFRLASAILRNRYDVVHCHLLASNWLGKPLARVLGTPVVISHDHCIDPWRANSRVVRSIDRLANRFADEIFAVSASTRDHLIDNEHISPAKIRVMPNCVPESPRRQHTGTAGKLIGGAGRLVPQKNFARFLQIARALTDIDASYRFMIAGEGPLEATLRKEAATLGVNVEWLGVQPSLDRFFSEIDLFLLTSDFEGSPMTLLEALAYGVPAAAMAVDGIQEEFTDEILLLNPGNTNLELSRFIHERLENRSELADQADRGREIVARRFSARKQAGEMEQLYVKVLESKRG